MKLRQLDKVLLGWTLLSSLYCPSDTLLVAGVTRSLRAYVDHVIKPILNVSWSMQSDEGLMNFNTTFKEPVTLKDYLHQLPFSDDDNLKKDIQHRNCSENNIMVMTRISDDNNTTAESVKWIKVSELTKNQNDETTKNSLSNAVIENELKTDTNQFGKENYSEEYNNNYEDVLYTFKDLVNIGLNPKVMEQMTEKDDYGTFNATYVMSIPKSTKLFELKITNLTQKQYNELNNLVKMHLQNTTYNSSLNNITEDKNTNVLKKDEKRQVSSNDWTRSSGLLQLGSPSSSPSNSESGTIWKKVPNEINLPLHQLFTQNSYETFKNNIKQNESSRVGDSNKKNNDNQSATNITLIKNNGFHAEIATDYMHKHHEGQKSPTTEYFTTKDSRYPKSIINNINLHNQSLIELLLNTNDTVIISLLKKVFGQEHAGDQIEVPDSTTAMDEDTRKQNTSNKSIDMKDLVSWVSIFGKDLNGYNDSLSQHRPTNKKIPQTNSHFQELNTIKTLNNSTSDEPIVNSLKKNTYPKLNNGDLGIVNVKRLNGSDLSNSFNLTENRETEKRNNDLSFITDFFHSNESYLLEEEKDGAKVMKINREGSILEELKKLMLEYFASLQLNPQELNNNSSVIEDIQKSSNLFELMQRSSQFVKSNIKTKIQNEKREPSTFVKKIIDTQLDKCKLRFNQIVNSINETNRKYITGKSIKKNNRRRFMNLTKCIASKVRECVIGFNMWLAKGKFYLRPQFKLQRAYENYEIERNLFCLRKYNATYLDSNLHGVRIWPGSKTSKIARRMKPGQRKFWVTKGRNIRRGGTIQKGNMMRKQKVRMMNNETFRNKGEKYHQKNLQKYPGNHRQFYPNQSEMGTYIYRSNDSKRK